jgi:hypothetical protein
VLLRNADPRLDPSLRPDQWGVAARRRRWLLFLSGLVGIALFGVTLVFFLFPMDRTSGLDPEEIAHAAGQAILEASRFSFKLFLDGEMPEQSFPTAVMAGQFQRDPLLLHLVGAVGRDDSRIPLEYYLEGRDLFVKDPGEDTWQVSNESDLGELQSYQPAALAVPFMSGLQRATIVGRDQMVGGEAIVLKLDLYDDVMPINLGQGAGRIEYKVWIYSRTLKPARLQVDYNRVGELTPRQVTSFSYVITFEFPSRWGLLQVKPLVVPDEVRQTSIEQ